MSIRSNLLRGCVTSFPRLSIVEQDEQFVAEQLSRGLGRQNGSRQGGHVDGWKGHLGGAFPALENLLGPVRPPVITCIGKISKGNRTKNWWRGFPGSLDTELALESWQPKDVKHFPHGGAGRGGGEDCAKEQDS